MKNGIFEKGLVFAIVVLFVIVGFVPCISGDIENKKDILQVNETKDKPNIYGPHIGIANVSYTFTTDPVFVPDGDQLYCFWDWGDGSNSSWLGPFPPLYIMNASHAWTQPGVYYIILKLKDDGGWESNWSDPFMITIVEYGLTPPIITGQTHGRVGIKYSYTFNSTDVNCDELIYMIDWGDGTHSEIMGPSAKETITNHTWFKKGTYGITARTKDIWGTLSGWGTLQVTMPRTYTYNPLILRLLERFPHAFQILRHLLVGFEA